MEKKKITQAIPVSRKNKAYPLYILAADFSTPYIKTTMTDKVYYGEKLFDPKWIAKRKRILQRDSNQCTICGKNEGRLHVHHKQYHIIKRLHKHIDPWDYHDNLLTTLCESCHSRGHYRYKIPIKYI